MFRIISLAVPLLFVPTQAQQQQSISQLALSINAAVTQMAQTIERQQQEIEQLKKELAIKDLPHDEKH